MRISGVESENHGHQSRSGALRGLTHFRQKRPVIERAFARAAVPVRDAVSWAPIGPPMEVVV